MSREDTLTGKQPLRLWVRLLGLNNVITQYTRARLRRESSITLPQFDVLAELDRAEQPLTMTELSRELMVSNGNVTGVIDRLERDGLVSRSASPSDRRVLHLALTTAGRKAFRKLAARHEAWIADLFAGLPQAEIRQCSEQLRRMKTVVLENINKVEDI